MTANVVAEDHERTDAPPVVAGHARLVAIAMEFASTTPLFHRLAAPQAWGALRLKLKRVVAISDPQAITTQENITRATNGSIAEGSATP